MILYKKREKRKCGTIIISTVQLNRLNSTAHFYHILATLNPLSIHARFCKCADNFGFQKNTIKPSKLYRILATLNPLSIHARFCKCADKFWFSTNTSFLELGCGILNLTRLMIKEKQLRNLQHVFAGSSALETLPTSHSSILPHQHISGGWHSYVDAVG